LEEKPLMDGPSASAEPTPSKYGRGVPLAREERLRQIRLEAESAGVAYGNVIRPAGAPIPNASAERGYYGLPALKAPPWRAEIPAYLFAGGAAGAAAVIGCAAGLLTPSDRQLIRDARWLAAIGGAISPALLVKDLGIPSRFLNMLRVFKVQSPMSVGSWTLVAFSSSAGAAAFAHLFAHRGGSLRFVENAAGLMSALFGLGLATYTGVLIGATAIPAWYENVKILPIHFAASGLGAGVSMLELKGHASNRALTMLGIASALTETAIGVSLEANKKRALAPLKTGKSGWITRLGGVLSGPLPLILRLMAGSSTTERSIRLRRVAAASMVAGSLLTRQAWVQAGRVSAKDPTVPLALPALPALPE
jgi:formate-dependent nitrite reductase membrane component NrfD